MTLERFSVLGGDDFCQDPIPSHGSSNVAYVSPPEALRAASPIDAVRDPLYRKRGLMIDSFRVCFRSPEVLRVTAGLLIDSGGLF